MSNKRIYKDFDLPTNHLSGLRHYVPPRARKAEEIERRKTLPYGVLVTEQQQRGLIVAAAILRNVKEPEDVDFSTKLIAASGINSAWYGYARYSSVMRRRLKLPLMGTVEPENRPNQDSLRAIAAYDFDDAALISGRLIRALHRNADTIETYQNLLGRRMGNVSLTLAAATLGDRLHTVGSDCFETQALLRRQGLSVLASSHILAAELGTPPSLAQLADHDSDLAVYLRRNAPNGALDAYEQAVDELRAA